MKVTSDLKGIKEGHPVKGMFVLLSKKTLRTKSNDLYHVLELRNATGTIQGKVWSKNSDQVAEIEKGDAVHVAGEVTQYMDYPFELDISDIKKIPGEHPVREYMNNRCPLSIEDMEIRFNKLLDMVAHPGYRCFLNFFFKVGCLKEDFFTAPAAISKHHNYIHGLLEHSLEVAEIGLAISSFPRFYTHVDRDLLITGALVHDSGKIGEYEWKGVPIGYSMRGKLMNHITIGPEQSRLTWEKCKGDLLQSGFTEQHLYLVQHIQISHHLKPEWQSPKEPVSPEAIIVHTADNASAQTRNYCDVIEYGVAVEPCWFTKGRSSVFVPNKYTGPEEVKAPDTLWEYAEQAILDF